MRPAGMAAAAVTDIGTDALLADGHLAPGAADGAHPAGHIDAEAANDYDLLPYPSMPITHTQPAHLAALARLFGAEAPSVERARVLELGCAAGGNIIPLAARFPQRQLHRHRPFSPSHRRRRASGLPHWPSTTSGCSRAT